MQNGGHADFQGTLKTIAGFQRQKVLRVRDPTHSTFAEDPVVFVLSPTTVRLPVAFIDLILDLVIELNGDGQCEFWRQQAAGSNGKQKWSSTISFPIAMIIACYQMNPTG